jgi:PAS domain S-box-containing protein
MHGVDLHEVSEPKASTVIVQDRHVDSFRQQALTIAYCVLVLHLVCWFKHSGLGSIGRNGLSHPSEAIVAPDLTASDSLSQAILNSLPQHIAVLDRSGAIVAVNDSWRRFAAENGGAEKSRTEVGVNYLSICRSSVSSAPESLEALEGIQQVLAGSQKRFNLEYACHSPSGRHWYRMEVLPLCGDSAGVIVSHEDVTEQKLAEEKQHEAEGLLVSLINATPDIICFKDEAGRWLKANKSILELYGLAGVEYQHKTEPELAEFTAPIYREAFSNCQNSDGLAWENGKLTRMEEVIPDVESNEHVYDVIKVPLFHPDRTPKGLVVFGRDITDRKNVENQLTSSLKEREVLLREVHHRVKNNMQVISSLLGLHMQKSEDPEALRLLKETEARVRSMALVHEKLYDSNSLGAVPFKRYLEDLTSNLVAHHRSAHVDVQLNLDNVSLAIGSAVPAGLIVNELVTNCLSHAFPEGTPGKIEVSLRKAGDLCTLTVADDGSGFPEDIDYRTASTLGLQLITTLTDQLHGTINLQTGEGTKWAISFQIPESEV